MTSDKWIYDLRFTIYDLEFAGGDDGINVSIFLFRTCDTAILKKKYLHNFTTVLMDNNFYNIITKNNYERTAYVTFICHLSLVIFKIVNRKS